MGLTWQDNIDFDGLMDRLHAAEPEAIARGLEHIRGVSNSLTPIETGNLIGSSAVEIDQPDSGYVSYKTAYAHRQHEELTWRHEHGQAKYLEQPMVTEADKALQIVGESIEGEL